MLKNLSDEFIQGQLEYFNSQREHFENLTESYRCELQRRSIERKHPSIDIDGHISDLIANFLFYDRKEDEDLPPGEIDRMVRDGEITIDDIVASFKNHLTHGLELEV